MIMIKELSKMIREELEDSERYAKCALKHRDGDRALADMLYNLSRNELDHSRQLHEHAVRLIKEYNGVPPESMQAVWDWEHELYLEEQAEIQMLLNMYKD